MTKSNGLFDNVGDDLDTMESQIEDNNKRYVDELVGEGKKFSDVEALARGKYQSDKFIERLKQELAEVRQDLRTQNSLQEMLREVRASNNHSNDENNNQSEDHNVDGTPNSLKPEDIDKIVSQKLQEHENVSQARRNIEQVKARLKDAWGPQYAQRLAQEVGNLGLEREFTDNLAATSPNALLKLLNIQSSTNTNVMPNSNLSNERFKTSNSNTSNSKNWKYYSEMRKKNPNEYYTPRVQQEMYKNAEALGESFYS